MRKLILILFALPLISLAQQTYVPDDNFEQTLINLGHDNILDDSVLTININTVEVLYIPNSGISDLTGIEDFTGLIELFCHSNQILSLDLSNNNQLIEVNCNDNQLMSMDIKNGNNLDLWYFSSTGNTALNCIDVDDVGYAYYTWSYDTWTQFSNNCNPSEILEYSVTKELLEVTDLLGRKTKIMPNKPLLYLYDDGTVKKRIVILK
jgi:hypothetical protein